MSQSEQQYQQVMTRSHSDFETWVRLQSDRINNITNVTNENGDVDPIKLNSSLSNFGGVFAWLATMHELESHKLRILNLNYERWYAGIYVAMFERLRQALGDRTTVTQKLVEQKITAECSVDQFKQRIEIDQQQSRVETLKKYLNVLEQSVKLLQTLSSNMRSELFFSSNATTGGTLEQKRVAAAKSYLKRAMAGSED